MHLIYCSEIVQEIVPAGFIRRVLSGGFRPAGSSGGLVQWVGPAGSSGLTDVALHKDFGQIETGNRTKKMC